MNDFGITINLSEDEKQSLEATMAKCYGVFKQTALKIFGSDKPVNVKKLRTIAGLPSEAKAAIDTINKIAPRVIAGHIRSVGKQIHYYYRVAAKNCHTGIDIEDFIQEARTSIYDAMFCFNGEYRFTTYIHYCVKRHLIKFGRLQAKCKLVQSEVEVEACNEDEVDLEELANERSLQLKAIAQAELTPIEKQLISEYMSGEKQSTVRQRIINPKTGKPYTRQRLTMAYNRAVLKIRASHALLQNAVA